MNIGKIIVDTEHHSEHQDDEGGVDVGGGQHLGLGAHLGRQGRSATMGVVGLADVGKAGVVEAGMNIQ